MGFSIKEVSFIKVLTDLRKGEHTASIDMQVLADLKRGLWPHTGCRQKVSLILKILKILKILLENPAQKKQH